MADHVHSIEAIEAATPTTPDAFLADRHRFWTSFTHFVVACAASAAVVLILMAIFLV
jgi:hypothetical protein